MKQIKIRECKGGYWVWANWGDYEFVVATMEEALDLIKSLLSEKV